MFDGHACLLGGQAKAVQKAVNIYLRHDRAQGSIQAGAHRVDRAGCAWVSEVLRYIQGPAARGRRWMQTISATTLVLTMMQQSRTSFWVNQAQLVNGRLPSPSSSLRYHPTTGTASHIWTRV